MPRMGYPGCSNRLGGGVGGPSRSLLVDEVHSSWWFGDRESGLQGITGIVPPEPGVDVIYRTVCSHGRALRFPVAGPGMRTCHDQGRSGSAGFVPGAGP